LIVGVNDNTFTDKSSYEEVLVALKSAGNTVQLVVQAAEAGKEKEKNRKSLLSVFGGKSSKEKDIAGASASASSPAAAATSSTETQSRPLSGSISGGAPATRSVTLKREENAGLGMQLRMEAKHVGEIADVIPDSPAAKAGVLAGDRIVEINGASVAGQTIDFLISHLKSNGSEVHLLLVSPVRKSLRQSVKQLFGVGGKSSNALASSEASSQEASTAGAASASSTPAPASAAPASAQPAASAAGSKTDVEQEVSQLRFRLAEAEMGRAAGEKRIQALTSELNDALQEIARLRAAGSNQ